jgi:hypothetical protein
VSSIGGDEVLVGLKRDGERGLEQRSAASISRSSGGDARARDRPRAGDPTRTGDLLRLFDEAFACLELAAETLDPRKLGVHFRPTAVGFGLGPSSEARLGRDEVVEVPQGSQAIGHD